MLNDKEQPKQKKHLTRKISFRLTEDKYEQIARDIAVSGITVSAFARKRMMNARVAAHADLAVLGELRCLGGLLKHVHNESHGAYSTLTAQAIRDLSAYVRALTEKRRDTYPAGEENA